METRYNSKEQPFSRVTEMIQTLKAIYHNPNQASTTRIELAKMMFKPRQTANIHRFISRFNSLAQKAKIPKK